MSPSKFATLTLVSNLSHGKNQSAELYSSLQEKCIIKFVRPHCVRSNHVSYLYLCISFISKQVDNRPYIQKILNVFALHLVQYGIMRIQPCVRDFDSNLNFITNNICKLGFYLSVYSLSLPI